MNFKEYLKDSLNESVLDKFNRTKHPSWKDAFWDAAEQQMLDDKDELNNFAKIWGAPQKPRKTMDDIQLWIKKILAQWKLDKMKGFY